MRLGALQQIKFFFQLGGAHLLQIFFHALQALFDLAEIADHQIELDILDVAQRIDRADVGDGSVFKGANHVGQRVDVAQVPDVGGLFQSFLADGADVHVFDRSVGELLGVVERRELVKAVVGDFGDSDVGLARVGVGWLGKMRLGENAEQRCLAYLGQANNAGFHKEALR